MRIEDILKNPIKNYLYNKSLEYKNNELARNFRKEFPVAIDEILLDKHRYKVDGSAGKGKWTECPWIAIFDILVTDSAQRGFYPVFLFKSDMSGVYLSLNQGVTKVVEDYKKDAKSILKLRAENYRAKIDIKKPELLTQINLDSGVSNAKNYEAGNIIAKYYPKENLPDSNALKKDIYMFLELYNNLVYLDNSFDELNYNKVFERKRIRLHKRIERNSSISKKVKRLKGYKCECCEMKFKDTYGELGEKFIEAHHLQPISELDIGQFKVDLKNDFAVLCSNCHRMIHKLDDPSNLDILRNIIQKNKSTF
ncbi:DUF3578 domain-containing protein [Kordia sp. TARA_039_SRF]|nr:DUF3578 domain-containing protein [Kordia sp. TARA_039_SRF]